VYDDWQAKTGVKLIAISIDDSRSMARVAPYVSGQSWDYDVYLDPNGDLKRAMNVQNVPHNLSARWHRQGRVAAQCLQPR
jgi:hypothetical protein